MSNEDDNHNRDGATLLSASGLTREFHNAPPGLPSPDLLASERRRAATQAPKTILIDFQYEYCSIFSNCLSNIDVNMNMGGQDDMTRSGKRLSAILYGLVMVMVGLLALATLAAAAGMVWTLFNPQTLWDAPLHIRYADYATIAWPNTAEARLALCGVGLLLCGIVATGLIPLLRLCRSAVAGNPFARENVGRLRMIALAFLLVALGQVAMPFVLPKAAQILFQPAESHLDLGPLLAALVILILADVFREGVRLREDAEGTI